jgi:hypothetical protein
LTTLPAVISQEPPLEIGATWIHNTIAPGKTVINKVLP